MSTRAIREALVEAEEHATTDCGSAASAAAFAAKLKAAWAEVAAIEKAAKNLVDCRLAPFVSHSPRGLMFYPAMEVIHAIAKETE